MMVLNMIILKIIHSPYGYNDVWVEENKLTLEGKYGNKLKDGIFVQKDIEF